MSLEAPQMEITTKTALAKSLGISRSSLYYKKKIPEKDEALKQAIEKVWETHPAYGHARLALELKRNKKPILRVMRAFGIHPPRRRAAKPVKLDDQNLPVSPYPNLIKELCPTAPRVIWASDFTYLPYQGRFLFLATVMDIFTREIVGWNVLSVHTLELVQGAFLHAKTRVSALPIFLHSDQGSEYTALTYLKNIEGLGIAVSHSVKASPWQNGYQESYYSGFKLDLGRTDQFETEGELVAAIYQTIRYYNHSRIHRTLKTSPMKFAQHFYEKRALQSSDRVS